MSGTKLDFYYGNSVKRSSLNYVWTTFAAVAARFGNPVELELDCGEYSKLNKTEKTKIKDGSYILPCKMTRRRRKLEWCGKINMVCIDFDEGLDLGKLEKLEWNWFCHSTFSSTDENPRYHLFVESDGKIDAWLYPDCVRTVSNRLEISAINSESLVACQPFYLPKILKDRKFFFRCELSLRAFDTGDVELAGNGGGTEVKRCGNGGITPIVPVEASTDAQVVKLLDEIDSSLPRIDWYKICCGLRHQYQNDENRGFEIFHAWSEKGENYAGFDDCWNHWNYCKPNPPDRLPCTIKTIRKYAETETTEKERDETDERLRGLFDGTIYVVAAEEFYDTKKYSRLAKSQFNDLYACRFGELVKKRKYSSRTSPASFLLKSGLCKIVHNYCYIPREKEFVESNGLLYVNTFRHILPPDRNEKPDEYAQTEKIIREHFETLFEREKDRKLVKNFMASTVQNPENKIRWVLLIQGVSGAGKSTIVDMLSVCLGKDAMSFPTVDDIKSPFNEWFEAKRVIVLEDLDVQGPDRWAVLQKMKHYITNKVVNVAKKFKSVYPLDNYANILALTEYRDAVPLDDNDRRWCPVYSRIQNRRQLEEIGGKAYFDKLHDRIVSYPGHIYRYFCELDVDPDFNTNYAPETDYKQSIIENSTPSLYSFISDLIEEDKPLVNTIVADLNEIVDMAEISNLPLGKYEMKDIKQTLGRKGYTHLLKATIKNESHNVYINSKCKDIRAKSKEEKLKFLSTLLMSYNYPNKIEIER